MCAYSRKIAQCGHFWYKFSPKGVYPLKLFLQNLAWGGSPALHPHAKFYRCGFKNVGLQPPKSQKLVFFGTYFPQKGISP